ncbi:MAG TPA: hypothetical protein PLP20_07300 [Oscillospiraceae bacterium]|mgnify:CR=1 FL=1|nr:hypothetical protein [Oscillospiraceae bacterium]HNW04848.1 hypothetical protein [Oscillospiraceae bacterium]HPW00843.1 hypothetical protein [Oscillospiraceae bacterium]
MENTEDSEELSMRFRADGCRIADRDGKLLLEAKLSGGFLKKRLDFYDADGNLAAKAIQTGLGRYRLDFGGQTMELRKRFSLTGAEYVTTGMPWVLRRSLLKHVYRIRKNGAEISVVRKKWNPWEDDYVVRLRDSADRLQALALAVLLDCGDDCFSRRAGQEEPEKLEC